MPADCPRPRPDRAETARRRLRPRSRRGDDAPVRGRARRQARGRGPVARRRSRPRSLLASGPAAALLVAERTALNFLGHLSGIATLTAPLRRGVAGTGSATSSTPARRRPGCGPWRRPRSRPAAAATTGWACYDAILIKENHIALAGGVAKAIYLARKAQPKLPIEIEVPQPRRDRLRPRRRRRPPAARQHGPGDASRGAVKLRDENSGSGNRPRPSRPPAASTSTTVRAIAETGVDFISVGALTHSAPSLDFSLLLEPA